MCSQVVERPKAVAKKPLAAPKLRAIGASQETTALQIYHIATHSSVGAAVAANTARNVKLPNASDHVALSSIAYSSTHFALSFHHHAVDIFDAVEILISRY